MILFNRFGALLGLSLLPLASLRAQSITYTPAQAERLAKLSELYGHVKFFHPYLAYKKINWDSAYAQNAPRIAAATTDAETAETLRSLLAVLGDAATTVYATKATPAAPLAADSVQVYWAADSTLTLKANAYAGADDYPLMQQKAARFARLLPRARAVLLDLRGARPLTTRQLAYFSYVLDQAPIARVLATQPYALPAMRLRGHSGFAPEEGTSSGGYYSYFYTRSSRAAPAPKPGRVHPTAILLNEHSALPATFYALRGQPQVRLFSAFGTSTLTDAALAETVTLPFGDNLTVELRTGELVNPDGTLGLQGLLPLPPTVRPEAAATYALTHLQGPRPAGSVGQPAPLPAPAAPTAYSPAPYPTLGYRLLAGAKVWAIIHYFHAYRDLYPTSWDAALRPALTELAAAPDATTYALALARYYRHIQDGHGTVAGQTMREYVGTGATPVELTFIDNQPVVSKIYGDSLQAKGLRVGDVLTAVNGEPIAARVARLAALRSASNEWTRLHYVGTWLLRAPLGTSLRVELRGADNRPKTVQLGTRPFAEMLALHDAGPAYRVLPGNIGYANLALLESADTDKMFEALGETKAIIFDMRGYPHGTAWSIAPRLASQQQPVAAKFFRYTPNTPSVGGDDSATEKYFFDQRIPAGRGKPVYKGKTVMLINERTQSQAEHTGLFFEAANSTEFIGSPSAGANGDVTYFAVPGGVTFAFSGHDVRHADGRQLQQVGLQPKVAVRPTLKGLRAGQDEVLDRAVKYLTKGS